MLKDWGYKLITTKIYKSQFTETLMRYSYIPTAINWHAPREGSYPGQIHVEYDSKEESKNNGPHPGQTPGDIEFLVKKD